MTPTATILRIKSRPPLRRTTRRRRTLIALLIATVVLGGLEARDSWSPASAAACTKSWVGGDGTFNEAAKWSPNGVPGANDDVCITAAPSGSDTYTVTYEPPQIVGGPELNSLTLGGASGAQTLLLTAPTHGNQVLVLKAPSTVNPHGVIRFDTPNASATIDSTYDVHDVASGSLSNHGQINAVAGDAKIELPLTNESDGVVDAAAGNLKYDLGAFDNQGSVTVESGASFDVIQRFSILATFLNTAGSLNVLGNFTLDNGSYTQKDGVTTGKGPTLIHATLNDIGSGGGPITIEAGASFLTGAVPHGQTLTVDGPLFIGSSVTNNGDIVLKTNGVLGLAGLINGITGGLANAGEVQNHGTIETVGSGQAEIAIKVTNFSDGLVDITQGSTVQDFATPNVFDNQGTFTVEPGATYTVKNFSKFTNTAGSLNAKVDGTAMDAAGAFVVDLATFTQVGGALTGAGPVFTDGSVLNDLGSGAGPITVRSRLNGREVGLSGVVPAGQTITLDSSVDLTELRLDTAVTNNGTIVLKDPSGTRNALFTVGSGSLVNNATINAEGIGNGKRINLPVTNSAGATIDLKAGTVVQDAGTATTNNGTLVIEPGAGYQLNNGTASNFTQGPTGSLHLTATTPTPGPAAVTAITAGGSSNPGSVTLAGELTVNTVGTPIIGARYHAIAQVRTTGTFSTYSFGAALYNVEYLPANADVDLISVEPLGITASLPAGPQSAQGVAYAGSLATTGGTAPSSQWTITSGALPFGLTLNTATGAITGTPTTAGSSSFDVSVIDAGTPTQHATAHLTIGISDTEPPVVSVAPTSVSVIASGSDVLTVTASDNVGVTKVEFYESASPSPTLLSTVLAPAAFQYTLNFTNANNGVHRYFVKAYDAANNNTTSALTPAVTVNIDTTPPVVSATFVGRLGTNGWYRSSVTVSWTVTDPESTPSACDPTTVSADTVGQPVSCTSTSFGGTTIVSVTVKRDATAPTLAQTVPNPIFVGDRAVANPNATDAPNATASGVASASCPALDTATSGSKSVSCTAIDNAGNTVTALANYVVSPVGSTTPVVLTSSKNPSESKEKVRFTATVFPTPTPKPPNGGRGRVQFTIDGQPFGDRVNVNADGTARSDDSPKLKAGSYTVRALYYPEGSSGATATSNQLTQNVVYRMTEL